MRMPGPFRIGDWLVRPESGSLERDGKVVKIEPRYMDLLVYLARHQGEVVSADEIHQHVWAGMVVGDHAVYQAVARLRKALGDRPGKPLYIETLSKRGYRLLTPVRPVDPAVPNTGDETGSCRTAAEADGSRLGGRFRKELVWGAVALTVIALILLLWVTSGGRDQVAGPGSKLAVLPFEMQGSQTEDAYLAYGLTSDLLNQLGRVADLQVLGQMSTARFQGKARDVREIGRQLAVDLLILGKVRIVADRLRVDIELVDAHSGARIWSERFEEATDNIFALQDLVAERVAEALGRRPVPHQAPYRMAPTETTLSAYDFYLLGRFYEKERSRKSLERALEMYRKAVEVDPELPGGHQGIASASLLLTYYGELSLSQAKDIALRQLELALQLDPGDEENYGTLGLARYMLGEYGLAEELLREALAINGNYALAWMWLGLTLEKEGKLNPAIRHYRHAVRLEPLSMVVNANLSLALESAGRPEEALARLEEVGDADASSIQYQRVRSALSLRQGDLVAAYRHARRALDLDPGDAMAMAQLALVLQDLGQQEARRKLIGQLLDRGLLGKAGALETMETIYMRLDRKDRERVRQMIFDLFPDGPRIAQIRWRRRTAFRGLSATYSGDYEEAVNQLGRAWYGGGYAIVSSDFDLVYCTAFRFSQRARSEPATAGLPDCEKWLQRARQQGWDSQWTDYAAVQLAALNGRHEAALKQLRALYQGGFSGVGLLENDPLLEKVRQRPEFSGLIDDMKQRAARAWEEIGATADQSGQPAGSAVSGDPVPEERRPEKPPR
ncbi:MAG TPA: hypothetical protein ENK50_08075 [Sedimenticola sp.]|nr:hypothetical protein [Sedimenticola sp.]